MTAPIDVLLDLDGTIHDPAPGIIGSVQFALRGLGLPVPDASQLRWTIGPPLRQSFPELGVPTSDVEQALALYRENYLNGAMYDAIVYPGIAAALDTLQARDHRLFVATSKPHVFARPIIEKFGLASHFQAIHGAELDGTRDDKADLIAYILATERIDKRHAVMIGDRKFDCLGATKNGVTCFGVLWGYGTATELNESGASRLLEAPTDIVPALVSFT